MKTIDELSTFEFHDALLCSAEFSGNDMIWELKYVSVHWAETSEKEICPLNPGRDRYAEPVLRLTFQSHKLAELWEYTPMTLAEDGTWIENPKKNIGLDAFPDIVNAVGNGTIALLYMGKEPDGRIACEINDRHSGIYLLTFSAEHIIAEWDKLGQDAWYLKNND